MPPARPPAPAPPGPPPYYVADTDLYLYNPEAGAMPVRAFAAGDRVPPDLVDAYGWAAQVRAPEPPEPPRPAPAAAPTTGTARSEQE